MKPDQLHSFLVNVINLLESHPLVCPECSGEKNHDEAICEDCRIEITVENTNYDNGI